MRTPVVVIGLGVVLVVVSVLADAIGLGREAGFGWKQWLGLVVGLAIVVAGLEWRRRSR